MQILRWLYCAGFLIVSIVSQQVSPAPYRFLTGKQNLPDCPSLVLQSNGFVTDTVQLLTSSSAQVNGLCGNSQLILQVTDDVTGTVLRVYRHQANDVVRIVFNGTTTNPADVMTACVIPHVCDASSAISTTLQATYLRMTKKIDDFFVNGYLYGRKIYIAGYKSGGPLAILLSVYLYNAYSLIPTTLIELDGSLNVWDKFFMTNVLAPFYTKSGIQGRWWNILINYVHTNVSPVKRFLRGIPDLVDMKLINLTYWFPSKQINIYGVAGQEKPTLDAWDIVQCAINATELPNAATISSLENYRYVLHGESCIIF